MNVGGRIRARLMSFALLDELGPLITLHTLWFADHGVGAAEISGVFVLWAAVGLLLEVPSGALADRVDRRRLIAFAVLLRAVGISVWLWVPTAVGLAVGASLWAAHSALASGAWEALIYDQLEAIDEAHDYQRSRARIEQASTAGILGSTVGAFAMLKLGAPLVWLGWVTVALHLPAAALVLTLPRTPARGDGGAPESLSFASWWRTLRAGVRQVTGRPVVGRAVLVAGALGGLLLIDEYVPLLGRVRGATDAQSALLVVAVWAGGLFGGELAARWASPSRWVSLGLLAGAALAAAALLDGRWWVLPIVALAYATQFLGWLYVDARIQEQLDSATRATATSVRELLSNLVSMVVLGVIGAMSVGEDPTRGLFVLLAGVALVALALARWVPDPPGDA